MRMKDRLGINNLIGICQPAEGYNKKVVSALTGRDSGAEKDAKRAAQRAEALEKQKALALQRQQEVQAQRERSRALREARIKRATVLASGTAEGIGMGSSPMAGGLASLSSQYAGNLASITSAAEGARTVGNLDTQINSALNAQRAAQMDMQKAQQKQSTLFSIFSLASGRR